MPSRPRTEAIQQSREHVVRVAEATQVMLQRVDAMESELGALVESLRTGSNRLAADLSLLQGNMGDLRATTQGGATSTPLPPPAAPPPAPDPEPPPAVAPEPTAAAPEPEPEPAPPPPPAEARAPEAAAEDDDFRDRGGRTAHRAQHGAERDAPRGDRPLPGGELRALRPRRFSTRLRARRRADARP